MVPVDNSQLTTPDPLTGHEEIVPITCLDHPFRIRTLFQRGCTHTRVILAVIINLLIRS